MQSADSKHAITLAVQDPPAVMVLGLAQEDFFARR